jgi:hypothetical protein
MGTRKSGLHLRVDGEVLARESLGLKEDVRVRLDVPSDVEVSSGLKEEIG